MGRFLPLIRRITAGQGGRTYLWRAHNHEGISDRKVTKSGLAAVVVPLERGM